MGALYHCVINVFIMSRDFNYEGPELPIEQTVCEIHWLTDYDYHSEVSYDTSKDFGLMRFKSIDDMFTEWFFITGLTDLPTPDDNWGVTLEYGKEGYEPDCGDFHDYRTEHFWIDYNPVPNHFLEGDDYRINDYSPNWFNPVWDNTPGPDILHGPYKLTSLNELDPAGHLAQYEDSAP